MYAKLVFRNAKRSVKDYLIYIVTMTICVTLFYSFLSISSRYYQPDIGSEYNFTILSDGMKAAICVITLFLLFLIRFVNHYMLRRKQKEFAVQSIMGMGQKTVGRLFFAETFMMGIDRLHKKLYFCAVGSDAVLIPGKAVLFQPLVAAVACFITIHIDDTIAFVHLDSSTRNDINDAPHGIAQQVYAIFNGFAHLFNMRP